MDRKGRLSKDTDQLQALKGERLSSVFSTDGTLIFASAAPHCGETILTSTELKYNLQQFYRLFTQNLHLAAHTFSEVPNNTQNTGAARATPGI